MADFSTTTISDALYKLCPAADTGGYLPDLKLFAGSHCLSGPVFPVQFEYKWSNPAPMAEHFVDACPPGSVLLLCPPSDATNACFGGLLASSAKTKSIAGVVANGRVRDLEELESSGMSIFAKGTSVCGQSPFLVPVKAGEPVQIEHENGHTMSVKPGDQLFADRNGVIIVDSARLNEIVEVGVKSEETDELCRKALLEGAGVKETFAKYRGKPKL